MARSLDAPAAIRAVAADTGARPGPTWPTGRTCREPGCDTRLSIYNRSTACSVHEEVRRFIVRGRRGMTADDLGIETETRRIA